MRPALWIPALALLPTLLAGTGGSTQATTEEPVDFASQIRPLLLARCVECHGPDRQKAALRLDRRDSALSGAYGGDVPVILPGDGTHSPLVQRVAGLVEGEDRMPPEGEPLSEEQIALLRRWIDEGARWPAESEATGAAELVTHWAYRPPARQALPAVGDERWCRQPLDRFVLARLEAEGLAPSPEADRGTLLRRATLDLTGLPPTPGQLDAFLNDRHPGAYERVVERLLASPAWAEHMTRTWLDLARYADTNGYEKDERRSAWRWRDWVLEAFAHDLPFDRFTLLQLAGDLLPEATLDDRIATGFHRNTMTNNEGGIDPEEFRVAAVIDRVNTTASVWLGTTLACAQCHNHKYDPFSQREYYGLYAFFDSTADTGNALAPEVEAPLPGQAEALARQSARVEQLEAALAREDPAATAVRAAWEAEARALVLAAPAPTPPRLGALATESGAVLAADEHGAVDVSGPDPETDAYTLELEPTEGRAVLALRLEALRQPDDSGPGRADHGNFVLTDVELAPASGEPVALVAARASFAQNDFPVALAIDDDPLSGWAVSDGSAAQAAEAVFFLLEPLRPPAGEAVRVVLRFESGYARHTLGRFRLTLIEDPREAALATLPGDVRAALAIAPEARDGPQIELLAEHHRRRVWPAGRALSEELERAARARDQLLRELPTALVMRELDPPRQTHVLERGSFLSPGEPVAPGIPSVLNPWPEGAPRNRLGLARWLVDPANPLTARVTVNRAWNRFFGRGLVATVEDFGTRGDAPTHPGLLDWLALDLVEQGWSLRALQRSVVTSATYRQDSRVTPALLERDPENRLLARAPRLRLEAEVVRDVALASAGLLDRTLGGPSVFPPQPEGVWASTYSGDRWVTSEGPGRWRRGLYTFLKRTSPYPSFMVFDGTSRELACTRRARTNTPLQALVLLNDPVYVEAAIGLARRALSEAGPGATARARHAFRLVTARTPTASELQVVLELLVAERRRFRVDLEAARALTTGTGLDLAGFDPAELAAWTVVAGALLNTDEFVTRG